MKYLLLTAFLFMTLVSPAQRTIVHCGKLIDVKNGVVLSQMTITIEGNKIISVDKGLKPAAQNDRFIDLSQKTVLPGLIDLHVHLEWQPGKDALGKSVMQNEADIAFESAVNAKITLMSGFTTVRDLGGKGVNISLRNAINNGLTIGPRVFTAGRIIASTGGHGDPTNGLNHYLSGDPGPAVGVINSPEDARKAVRQLYKDGADLIKVTATGGVISIAKDGSGPQLTEDELKTVVQTARDYNFHVAAHAHGPEGMKRAVLAGVTTIEHGTKMTEEIMDLMKQKGTYLVPTITAGKAVADNAKIPGFFHPLVVPKALDIGPALQETFRKAYKRGVRIAFGTDAGVYPHGQNGKEFAYMVEAGMPMMECIRAATIVNASILGMSDQIGSLEPSKLADLIATDQNPIDDVHALENVSFVMKEGIIYK